MEYTWIATSRLLEGDLSFRTLRIAYKSLNSGQISIETLRKYLLHGIYYAYLKFKEGNLTEELRAYKLGGARHYDEFLEAYKKNKPLTFDEFIFPSGPEPVYSYGKMFEMLKEETLEKVLEVI